MRQPWLYASEVSDLCIMFRSLLFLHFLLRSLCGLFHRIVDKFHNGFPFSVVCF